MIDLTSLMDEDRSWVRARYPAAAAACLEESGLPGWAATKWRGSGILLAWGPTEGEVWRMARREIEEEEGAGAGAGATSHGG